MIGVFTVGSQNQDFATWIEKQPLVKVTVVRRSSQGRTEIKFENSFNRTRRDGKPDQLLAVEEVRGAMGTRIRRAAADTLPLTVNYPFAMHQPQVPFAMKEYAAAG
jgi:hypothetical protein